MQKTSFNVVIPEPITSLNKGEAAILRGIQKAFEVFGNVSFAIHSPWPEIDQQRYSDIKILRGTDLFDLANRYLDKPIERSSFHYYSRWIKLIIFALITNFSTKIASLLFKDEFFDAMANCDMILAGHDGFLTYQLFWFVIATKLLKKPFVIYGAGIDTNNGKHKSAKTRLQLRLAIKSAIFCSVRDQGSYDYLLANGIPKDVPLIFPDPAVLMEPCEQSQVIEILNKEKIPQQNEIPLVGLIPLNGGIVFDCSFADFKIPEERYGARIRFWVDMLNSLSEQMQAHFLFLPHCIGPTTANDDRVIAKEIYSRLHDKSKYSLITNEYTESQLKGLMRACEFVFGERTHGLIGSVSVATPCVAFSVEEDHRMHNIIGKMFKRPVYNLNRPVVADVCKLIINEWNNRNETHKEMMAFANDIHNNAKSAANILFDRIKEI